LTNWSAHACLSVPYISEGRFEQHLCVGRCPSINFLFKSSSSVLGSMSGTPVAVRYGVTFVAGESSCSPCSTCNTCLRLSSPPSPPAVPFLPFPALLCLAPHVFFHHTHTLSLTHTRTLAQGWRRCWPEHQRCTATIDQTRVFPISPPHLPRPPPPLLLPVVVVVGAAAVGTAAKAAVRLHRQVEQWQQWQQWRQGQEGGRRRGPEGKRGGQERQWAGRDKG